MGRERDLPGREGVTEESTGEDEVHSGESLSHRCGNNRSKVK